MTYLHGDLPAAPSPERLAEVADAAARARDLWSAGRELHFTARPGHRVVVELRGPRGELLRSLTPSQALDMATGAVTVWPRRVPCGPAGYATGMEDEREVEKLEQESERVGRRIDEAREALERTKADPAVPGAAGDVGQMAGEDRPETDYPAKG